MRQYTSHEMGLYCFSVAHRVQTSTIVSPVSSQAKPSRVRRRVAFSPSPPWRSPSSSSRHLHSIATSPSPAKLLRRPPRLLSARTSPPAASPRTSPPPVPRFSPAVQPSSAQGNCPPPPPPPLPDTASLGVESHCASTVESDRVVPGPSLASTDRSRGALSAALAS